MRAAINVLVVVLILLVTGGLVVAAVGRLRESAARLSCRNGLKQIGIATINYHDAQSYFPLAAMPTPAGLAPEQRLSWRVSIFPYSEATPYYALLDLEKGWAGENRFLAVMPPAPGGVECPNQATCPPVSTLFPTSYVGVAGLGEDALSLPAGSDRAGAFGYDRQLKLANIPNTSSLLLAVETAQVQGAWTAAGPPTARGVELDAPAYLGPGAPFGGLHRGGANALFADGSVRFVSDSVDPDVFRSAASVRGSAAGRIWEGP
jgi:prepilin-type processing-associated H-X9-DG protein